MREEHEIVQLVYAAQNNPIAADELINKYMPFIKSETAKFMKRMPVEGRDDELSIAMFAFYESLTAYDKKKGSFLHLAAITIHNRLVDYTRKEQRHAGLVSLEQPVGSEDDGRTFMDELPDSNNQMAEFDEIRDTKLEIEHFASQLNSFGLCLTDIAENCPKQERTLSACMRALEYARSNTDILEELLKSKKLPVSQLAAGAKVERKTLERHRKYMVAILIAYTNGYEIIRGHLQQIDRKGGR